MKQTSQTCSTEEKHKFSATCFNHCVEWKLNASINQNKTSPGYVRNYELSLDLRRKKFVLHKIRRECVKHFTK